MAESHPFIDTHLPSPWSQLTADGLKLDILYAIDVAKKAISGTISLRPDQLSFDSVFAALDLARALLSRGWNRAKCIAMSLNTPEYCARHSEALPLVSQFQSSIHLNSDLWQILKHAAASLTPAEQRLITETLTVFRREWADLSAEDRVRMERITRDLSMASQQFRTTLLNSMGAFELYVEHEEELSGVSGADKAVMRQSAESKGRRGSGACRLIGRLRLRFCETATASPCGRRFGRV
jgi:Zn-dependent oligopeptidase